MAEPWVGWRWAARAISSRGVAQVQRVGGRSPVVNGQVPFLLVGMAVGLLAVVRKMPRSGWGGKLNFIAACRDGRLPLSGTQEICPASLHCSISLLLEEK